MPAKILLSKKPAEIMSAVLFLRKSILTRIYFVEELTAVLSGDVVIDDRSISNNISDLLSNDLLFVKYISIKDYFSSGYVHPEFSSERIFFVDKKIKSSLKNIPLKKSIVKEVGSYWSSSYFVNPKLKYVIFTGFHERENEGQYYWIWAKNSRVLKLHLSVYCKKIIIDYKLADEGRSAIRFVTTNFPSASILIKNDLVEIDFGYLFKSELLEINFYTDEFDLLPDGREVTFCILGIAYES